MGIQELKSEIIRSAKQSAREMENLAQEESDNFSKEAQTKLSSVDKGIKEREIAIVRAYEASLASKADFLHRKAELEIRKKMIEMLYERVKSKLALLPVQKRREHLLAMLDAAGKTIEIGRIICSNKDRPYMEKLAKGMQCIEGDIIGGLIAEDESATVRIDFSYESILTAVYEKSQDRASAVLFGGLRI